MKQKQTRRLENRPVAAKGRVWGKEGLGGRDSQVQTTIHRMDTHKVLLYGD